MPMTELRVIFVKCAKRRKKNKENFLQSFEDPYLQTGKRNLLKFGMWLPMSGGHFHCKFRAKWPS